MRFCTIIMLATVFAAPLRAVQRPAAAPTSDRDTTKAAPTPIPNETSSATDHTIRIGGQLIPYCVTAATMLPKNEKDEAIAALYYAPHCRPAATDPSPRASFLT